MSNMFQVFEPQSMMGISASWVGLMVSLVMIFPLQSKDSDLSVVMKLMITNMQKNLKVVLSPSKPGTFSFMLALFLVISLSNLMSLIPYTFTPNSHLAITLALALPLWLGHMLFSSYHEMDLMLAHFVPSGTPIILIPLMIIIEVISSLIRPITLSVRLMANMTAGHVLLSIISGPLNPKMWMLMSVILPILIGFLILEIGVSVIQGYVFSLLSTLYIKEVSMKTIITK